MTEIIDNCSDTPKLSIEEIQKMMDADPSHRLVRVLGKLEDLEGLVHVLYKAACYESDCENEKPIFELGLAEGGARSLIEVLSTSLKSVYKEIWAIQSDLPRQDYTKCSTTQNT